MAPRRRRDADYVAQLPALRRIVPYLMPTRVESTIYYPQRIEVENLLGWLQETNLGRPADQHLALFHVLLTAIARAIRLRPQLNRFIVGARTYAHKDISISFVVKTSMDDDAEETEVRIVFTGRETVEEVRDLVEAAVAPKRRAPEGRDDRLVTFFASWPRPVLAGIARLIGGLDRHNALPSFLEEAIPLYTSAYVVNAGSIGIDPPFHHLYEHGSASVFVSIGRIRRQPVVDVTGRVVARRCLDVVYTLDERATDGFYLARTAEVFRRLVAEPELLDKVDVTVDELLAGWPHGA